jgi:hypothetical protein
MSARPQNCQRELPKNIRNVSGAMSQVIGALSSELSKQVYLETVQRQTAAMAELISISSLLLMLVALVHGGMIYRRYEKQHPSRNYTQIVEIFETIQRPPHYSENDRALNDFLGRDAFKSDMNCTKQDKDDDDSESVPSTTTQMPTTTTTRYTIPTTAYRRSVPVTKPTISTTTTMKSPNLDHLFTIKTTKPTIRPNPKENENPDYTELYNWPTPHVQVTKHIPATVTPLLIFIKETDDVQSNRTTTRAPTTTQVVEETTATEYDYNHEENGLESDNDTVNGDFEEDDYEETRYDIIPDDQVNNEQTDNGLYDGEDDEDDEDEFDDDFDAKKRRKRLNLLRKRRAHKRTV